MRNSQLKDGDQDYEDWLKDHVAFRKELKRQRTAVFSYSPLISIVMVVTDTDEQRLKSVIDAYTEQTYGNWQLCLADACEGEETGEFLRKKYKKEIRLSYKKVTENHGVSGKFNVALKLAMGKYVLFAGQEIIPEPDALFQMVKAITAKKADMIYTDEDEISADGKHHFEPKFNPDFNLFRLRENNYIGQFWAIRKEILEHVGKFDPEYDGAQDYDVILRCTEKARKTEHIAKILYHWRMHDNSTAANPASKAYCHEAGRKAVEDHLKRLGIPAKVELCKLFGGSRVIYETPGNPLVSIVIPNKDHIDDLDKCVRSLFNVNTYKNIEVIIVENNSTEKETFEYYDSIQKEYSNVKVLVWKREFNYSAINNFGVKEAKGDYILLLNNDTEMIAPDSISDMLGYCMRPDVGIVGAKLLYPDGTIQHAGVIIGLGGIAGHAFIGLDANQYGYMSRAYLSSDYSAVTAACLMISKEIYNEVGGLCEQYAVAFNDVDFCMKVRSKGYLVVYDAFSQWYHYESKSRGYEDTEEKQLRFKGEIDTFKSKWQKELDEGDPFYNRNFPLNTESYTLELE